MAQEQGIGQSVASHYNNLQEKGVESRKESRIYHMRNFNNFIKSILIQEFSDKIKQNKPRPRHGEEDDERRSDKFNVLDIGCGKGGDLLKWSKARIGHYVGVDIAETSVEQAKSRYADMKYKQKNRIFSGEFYAADCTKANLEELYEDKNIMFDIVTCQFAFHYCFESLDQADCMLKNISSHLKVGGYFLGTTTDANDIVARVRAGKASNSVFNIKFDSELSQDDPPPLFGAKYHFHLEGVVDCPEFLVHFPTLIELADKHGLMLMCQRRFDSYFNTWKDTPNGAPLLRRMNALEEYNPRYERLVGGDPKGPQYVHAQKYLEGHPEFHSVRTLSKDEWDAITLYLVFAFKKIR